MRVTTLLRRLLETRSPGTLADEVGVSQRTVERWITGDRTPSPPAVATLRRLLGGEQSCLARVAEMMEAEEEPDVPSATAPLVVVAEAPAVRAQSPVRRWNAEATAPTPAPEPPASVHAESSTPVPDRAPGGFLRVRVGGADQLLPPHVALRRLERLEATLPEDQTPEEARAMEAAYRTVPRAYWAIRPLDAGVNLEDLGPMGRLAMQRGRF